MRPGPLVALFGAAGLAAAALGIGIGAQALRPAEIIAALAGEGPAWHRTLVLDLRLPRVISAFTVGGLLAFAGVLMQVLLRNPLADPYILGTSGGAAVGAIAALLLGLAGWSVELLAFAGALASTFLVFVIGGGLHNWDYHRLLLTGIVVAAGWGAVITLLLSLSPGGEVHGLLFWLMGDLTASGRTPGFWFWLPALFVLGFALGRPLNLLVQGPVVAASLGVAIRPTLVIIFGLSSLATALAVSQAGNIGFIGLVIPHLLRLLGIRDHRLLLPCSLLAGGSLLVLADTAARTVLAPQQLPVGVLTAFLGVPLFLYLLNREYRLRGT